jgi:hypothetical protein
MGQWNGHTAVIHSHYGVNRFFVSSRKLRHENVKSRELQKLPMYAAMTSSSNR